MVVQTVNVRWQTIDLGQGIYYFYPTAPSTAAGANVTVTFNIPFPFKILAMFLEHTDSAFALSTDALTWSFNIAPRAEFKNNFPIVAYSASASSQFYELFGEDYLFPAGTYRFIHNTTATDLIYFSFILQKRGLGNFTAVTVKPVSGGGGGGDGGGIGYGGSVL